MSEVPQVLKIVLPEGVSGRLDKALAAAAPEGAGLSRSRIQALIAEGAVSQAGQVVRDPKARVAGGEVWAVAMPAPVAAEAEAENIPLSVVYEDADVIVVDKPAGMVVHPAPGAERGTLVNALLHHCGDSLRGIGGVARPGIVHRIDKDTSGLLVVAKTAGAHEALAAQFAAHSVHRRYLALCWGVPDVGDPRLRGLEAVAIEAGGVIRIDAPLGRHPGDRKKMAVVPGGRRAVTRVVVDQGLGACALLSCRLETGRTHQIRVHLAHVGHPLVGDPVYGQARKAALRGLSEEAQAALAALPGQALHAAELGFKHPERGEMLQFRSELPPQFNDLLTGLRESER